MSPRQLVVAGVLRRRRPCGSALREPSAQEVYEGRLPAARPPVVVVNFLDVAEAAVRAYEPARVAPVQAWAPWCDECGLEPLSAHTQDGAQYLARVHDAVHHHGAWTARVVQVSAEPLAATSGGVR